MALTVSNSVAGQLLRVALAADAGKLAHDGALALAARGALMIDLVEVGVLTRDDNGTQISSGPTGLTLADELIRAVSDHPDRTMERWLRRGVPHLDRFVDALISEGCWTLVRHGFNTNHATYDDTEHEHYQQLRSILSDVIRGRRAADSAHQAALAVMANAINVLTLKPHLGLPPPDVLSACGDLSWIVADVANYLNDAQSQDLAAGRADGASSAFQLGSQ